MNVAQVVIGLLAGLGTFLAGVTAYVTYQRGKTDSNRTTALDLLQLALDTFKSDNDELRERIAVMETDLRGCEHSKRVQGERIGELEAKLRTLEAKP